MGTPTIGADRTPTQEDMKNMEQVVDRKYADGGVSKAQAKQAKDLGSGIVELLSFEEVNGLADYSVWNEPTKELMVFHKGLQFCIEINAYNNANEDKQKAIEAAQLIIKEKL